MFVNITPKSEEYLLTLSLRLNIYLWIVCGCHREIGKTKSVETNYLANCGPFSIKSAFGMPYGMIQSFRKTFQPVGSDSLHWDRTVQFSASIHDKDEMLVLELSSRKRFEYIDVNVFQRALRSEKLQFPLFIWVSVIFFTWTETFHSFIYVIFHVRPTQRPVLGILLLSTSGLSANDG